MADRERGMEGKIMSEFIEKIKTAAAQMGFNGLVSIDQDGCAPYCGVFGYRDFKEKLPVTQHTKFAIASGTKLFTALGIGRLIESGAFALDTPVGEVYPQHGGYIALDATIRQLLGHTSGIYDYFDEEAMESCEVVSLEVPPCRLEGPEDYMPMFAGKALKFPPGQRFSYSNGGYVFLALLIEKVSGKKYRDYIASEVLKPVGMCDSGFFAFYDLPSETARGYRHDCRTTNIYTVPVRGGGDGGMYTTSADLCKFWQALFSFEVLPRKLAEEFFNTHYSFNDSQGYGLGLYKQLDGSCYSIVGGDCGVGFYSAYYPEDKTTVSIFSNITDGEERMREVVREFFV